MGKPRKSRKKKTRKTERRMQIKPGDKTFLVVRDKRGRFKDWVSIPRSIAQDAARKAENVPKKPGRGHRGDYPKRR